MQTPQPCSQDNFIDAQLVNTPIGWATAGNGESFKVVSRNGYTAYARTGKQYWKFETADVLSHGAIMAKVFAVIAEERNESVEPV